jgi:hypothetical protein
MHTTPTLSLTPTLSPSPAPTRTQVLPAALAGLQDRDDDVRAAAADALWPVVPALTPSAADADVRASQLDISLSTYDDPLCGRRRRTRARPNAPPIAFPPLR